MANVTDPVCGMQIDDANAAGKSTHEDQTYYFCAQECKDKFDANPQQYTTPRGEAASGGGTSP